MSALDNLRIVEAYLVNHDPKYFAVDALYQDMANNESLRGREAVAKMLRSFYREAFTHVDAEVRNIIANERSVVVESVFRGLNSGSWQGRPATNKSVEFPYCVVYDVDGDVIRRARSYMDWCLLDKQLGAK